jgi:hypothetical protein
VVLRKVCRDELDLASSPAVASAPRRPVVEVDRRSSVTMPNLVAAAS